MEQLQQLMLKLDEILLAKLNLYLSSHGIHLQLATSDLLKLALVLVLLIVLITRFKSPETSETITVPYNQSEKQSRFAQKNDAFMNLSIQEKLDLSWKFLMEITEKVVNSFSKVDREEVHRVGGLMFKAGVRYDHAVELGIQYEMSKAQAISAKRNQDQSEHSR